MAKDKLAEAIELRKNNKPEDAMLILTALLESYPNDLKEDRSGAMLGLGSTYRCLGEYEKSLKVFDQAIQEFPEDRALKVFRALTLYSLGKAEESVSQLLIQLLDTTNDDSIKSYDRALRFYSDKLNETWK